MNADQLQEAEALRSIYAGDERFLELENTKFQYKIGDPDHFRSFIVEISWPENYPQDELPTISLDLFYNKHLIEEVKSTILSALQEEANTYAGMPATYALFEFVRENGERLAEAQPESIPTIENEAKTEENVANSKDESASNKHLSKAQKRRMWDRGEMGGDRARGWNWVDIIRHLSQIGPQSE